MKNWMKIVLALSVIAVFYAAWSYGQPATPPAPAVAPVAATPSAPVTGPAISTRIVEPAVQKGPNAPKGVEVKAQEIPSEGIRYSDGSIRFKHVIVTYEK